MKRLSIVCLVAAFAAGAVRAADKTVEPSEDAVAVINAAQDGDTITFPAGTWALNGTASITKNVKVVGAGVGQTIFTGGSRHERCFEINNADAELSGFTLDGVTWDRDNSSLDRKKKGHAIYLTLGSLHNVRLSKVDVKKTYWSYGSTLYMEGGHVADVTFDGGTCAQGECYGLVYQKGGVAERCVYYGNLGGISGGALYLTGGTNSFGVFYNNVARGGSAKGGGVLMTGGTLSHATIAGNGAGTDSSANTGAQGGGLYQSGGVITNCIVWGNAAPSQSVTDSGRPEFYTSVKAADQPKQIFGLCTAAAFGTDPVALDPQFVNSSAYNFNLLASSPCILANGTTLGAYAYDRTKKDAALALSPRYGYPSQVFTFSSTVRNVSNPVYAWTVTDADGATVKTSTDASFTSTFAAGTYDVELVVTDGTTPVATDARPAYFRVHPLTNVVEKASDEATATAELKDAIENAIDGQVVKFGEGTWTLPTATLSLTKNVKVFGAGKDKTVFTGGSRAAVCFSVGHADAEMSGFTLRDLTWNTDNRLSSSACFNLSAGHLHDIDVININGDKTGQMCGLGCYQTGGRIADMLFDNCHSSRTDMNTYGSGVRQSAGTSERITIRNCYGRTYGALYLTGGVCSNSIIACNKARSSKAMGGGVTMSAGTLAHATLYKNEASTDPANCTGAMGGGLYHSGGIVTNCIVWASVAPSQTASGAPNWYTTVSSADQAKMIFNLCSTPALGMGAITGDPQFEDADNGNFAVKSSSSCLLPDKTTVGAIPYDFNQADASMSVSPTEAFDTEEISFSSTIQGVASPVYEWAVTKQGEASPTHTSTASGFTRTFAPGVYDVSLTVYDGVKFVKTDARSGYLTIHALTNVVEATTDALKNAVESAIDGQVIVAKPGCHEVTDTIMVNAAVTIIGAGADKTMVKKTGSVVSRVFYLNNANASITGLTVTGGRLPDSARDSWGAGIWIGDKGGTVSWCTITNNATSGGHFMRGGGVGMTGDGLVTHCIIRDNSVLHLTKDYGGGAALSAGRLENCLIDSNSAIYGGGVAVSGSGKVRNCTIVNNTGTGRAGGLYWWSADQTKAEVRNCVFSGNIASVDTTTGRPHWAPETADAANYAACQTAFATCGFEGLALGADGLAGVGSVVLVEPFENLASGDYHLKLSAAGINAGSSYDGMPELDLAGGRRVIGTAVEMGAYETDTGKFGVSFAMDKLSALQNVDFTATATVNGSTDYDLLWTVTGPDGSTVKTATTLSWTDSFADEGTYGVSLTGTDRNDAQKTQTVTGSFYVGPRAIALAEDESIHDALARALDGTVITLSPGTYSVTNRVTVDKGVTIVGPGYKVCTVRRGTLVGQDNRVFYLNHADAVLRGVTVTEGVLGCNGGDLRSECGAGVCIAANGGTLEDCRITANKFDSYYMKGAGVGVTSAKGVVRNCLIDNNDGRFMNQDSECGGGVYMTAGVMSNCVIYANQAEHGGGLAIEGACVVRNCTITGNEARHDGGGVYHYSGSGYTVTNTIFYANTDARSSGAGFPEWSYHGSYGAPLRASYCSFTPGVTLPTGAGNFNADPQFKDPAKGKFGISADSPCARAAADGSYIGAVPPRRSGMILYVR